MKLTNRSEYGLLALAFLARLHAGGERASADTIAGEQKIPKRFLQQILFQLKGSGYVTTVKGKDGGYALARPPEKVTVAEVIRFFEGPLAATTSVSKNFYEPSPIEAEKGFIDLFRKIRDETARILESTTLADVSRIKTPRPSRSK